MNAIDYQEYGDRTITECHCPVTVFAPFALLVSHAYSGKLAAGHCPEAPPDAPAARRPIAARRAGEPRSLG
jgi:hypothetical protein